jgi:SOS-response transcriptional repressor LexA
LFPLAVDKHFRDNSRMPSKTINPAAEVIERIDERRRFLKISDREFSLRVTGKPDFLRDMKRRGHLPSAENTARAAEVLGVSIDWLLGHSQTQQAALSEVTLGDRIAPWNGPPRGDPPIPLVGTGDCADLEVCDESGHLVSVERSSFDPDYHVRYLARPPALLGARDLYAIYFHGDSMLPRFEPGEVGIVDPRRPVASGDYVLVQLRDDGDDSVTSVLAKRLVRQTTNDVVLEQFNPAVTFTIPRTRVARIHRIMRQTDLLF